MKLGIVLLGFLFSLQVFAVQHIKIGFDVGPDDFQKRKEKIAKFSQELAVILGLKVDHFIFTSNMDLVKAMNEKKIDFAFLNTMSLVYVEKQTPVKILLKANFSNPYYHSIILVPNNSKMAKIEDLVGKKLGVIDNHSASGYLLPVLDLREKKLESKVEKVQFSNHKQSVEALLKNKIDAVATYASDEKMQESGLDLVPGTKTKFKMIWISKAIPTNPFVVRDEFYKEHEDFVEEFMMRLTAYKSKAKISEILFKYLNIKELVLANSKQYEVVRKLTDQLEAAK